MVIARSGIWRRFMNRPIFGGGPGVRVPTTEPQTWNERTVYLSASQVEHTKRLLSIKGLPIELIDEILDFAEYWPVAEFCCSLPAVARAEHSNKQNASILYLRTLPLPGMFVAEDGGEAELIDNYDLRGQYPIRKVEFRLSSRDQGWSSNQGRGTYKGAFSWVEAFAERPCSMEWVRQARMLEEPLDISLLPPDKEFLDWRRIGVRQEGTSAEKIMWCVQRNIHAGKDIRHHEVVWRADDPSKDEKGRFLFETEAENLEETGRDRGGAFVRCLRPGDRINLLVRAKYPGWTNEVRKIQILVYYAV